MDWNIFKILWVFQGAFWLGMVVFLMPTIWRSRGRNHVLLVTISYAILTLIDVYTIIYESYPVLYPKSILMLIAFILGDVSLLFYTQDRDKGAQK